MIAARAGGALLAVCAALAAGGAGAQTLEEALAFAYTNNPTLLAERARLRGIDESVPEALAGGRSTVQLQGDAGVLDTETRSRNLRSDDTLIARSYEISVVEPLYLGGRVDAEVESAESAVRAGRAGLSSVEQRVMLESATAYMDVLSEQAVLDLNRNNERVVRRQLQAAEDRFEVGQVTRTDVAQAEARLAQATADRIAAEGRLVTARSIYKRTIGALPGALAWPALPPDLPQEEEEAIARAERNNPSISAADFTARAARADIEAWNAARRPRVSLRGSYGRRYDQTIGVDESATAALRIDFVVPLYQSGAESARVRRAKQVAAQRRFERDQVRRDARLEATSAWGALVTARARIAALESQAEAATIALEGVTQEAFVGLRTTLDVLDSEQELFRTNVSLVQAQRDEIVSAFRLQSAVGSLTAQALRLPVEPYDTEMNHEPGRGTIFELGDMEWLGLTESGPLGWSEEGLFGLVD